ncbi:hypothetical protein K505DRAFT_335021 [Melanomma pulvis-pyrius CBS 109.77]|uniref:Uncharacterized protein n=1 Tax=Melanomma pulvis-pyrius CBS 109.77 TaxID=1314802 RepID=A0A6A6XJL5_9PLEO|nr:hypothetical protein K505DRAFT_335021 [Melanomma pulvis-pyrius CBS 109.77]
MKCLMISYFVGIWITSIIGAPAFIAKTSFVNTCTNIALKGTYWLVADCPSGDDSELPGDQFKWNSYAVIPLCPSLTHTSAKSNFRGVNWTPVGTFCRDSDHIFNYAGYLLQNLRGEPLLPVASTFPVPATDRDFEYNTVTFIGLNCTGSYGNFHGYGPSVDCYFPKPGGQTPYRSVGLKKQYDTDVVSRYNFCV